MSKTFRNEKNYDDGFGRDKTSKKYIFKNMKKESRQFRNQRRLQEDWLDPNQFNDMDKEDDE